MEIKLTIELEKPKNADCDLVLAAAEEIFRPLIEELREAGSKAAYPLVSAHSDWELEIEESDWNHDFYAGIWDSNISIYLKIAEIDSGNVVDEYLAWELLGEPVDKEVFEPLHSCDWSGLQRREGIDLQFSSLKAMPNNGKDGLFFYYNHY
jgi:hypothetical protein